MAYTEEYSGKYNYIKQDGIVHPTKHPLFVTWRMMNVRCYDTRHKAYHRYGGRGIEVCDLWRWDNKYGFKNFLSSVGERLEGTTLDKIYNDGWYCPENVRWADKRQQQNNMTLNDDVGVKEMYGRLEVSLYLNGKCRIIGIFPLDEIEKAKARYEDVKRVKMNSSDEEAFKYAEDLDEKSPTNKRLRLTKTSKYYGVSWDSSRGKWKAMSSYRETPDGDIINKMLGRFDSEEEAYKAVLKFIDFVVENGYFKKLSNKEFLT